MTGRESRDLRHADRIPGAYSRALARLLTQADGGPSVWALARLLRDRLRTRGVHYHPRTLRRQLRGDVSTVPRAVELELVALVGERLDLHTEQAITAQLDECGLEVSEETRAGPRVPSRRVVRLARLWLHLHPERSKRSLAHELAADLARQGVTLAPGHLEAALGGRGRTVRREVLDLLLRYLEPHGVRTEDDARKLLEDRKHDVAQAEAGRELVSSATVEPLVKVWQRRGTGTSIRRLAALVHTELARRGQRVSQSYLQSQLGRRRAGIRREVVDALENVVRESLPPHLSLETELERSVDNPLTAADAAWVATAPMAELADAWLAEHPEVSRRQLAIRIARTVRRMGYQTTHNTVQVILAGKTTRTRGNVYRALLKQLGPEASERILPEHILDDRVRRRLQAAQKDKPRAAPARKIPRLPGEGATDAMSSFLREVDRVPPLSHEEEIAAAKQIEAGERAILEAVLRTPVGLQDLVQLGDRLRRGGASLRDVIRDHNDKDLDPLLRQQQLLELFRDLEQLAQRSLQLTSRLQSGDLSAEGVGVAWTGIERMQHEIHRALQEARLAWEPVRAAARRVKETAQQIELGMRSEPGKGPSLQGLTVEQWRSVHEDIREGERLANQGRARLVESYLWLVNHIARKHVGRGLPFLDLVQEGALGLLRAAEKFDYRLGYRFPTYASWWIRSNMARALTEQGRTIRVPVSAAATLRRLIATRARMSQELGREPRSEELAVELDLPVPQVWSLQLIASHARSLSQPVGDADDATLEEFIEDERARSPSDSLAAADLSESLREALGRLSPREEAIVRRRFGINGGGEHTLAAIGESMGVSRERVRQIESRALGKLRNLGIVQELEPYLEE